MAIRQPAPPAEAPLSLATTQGRGHSGRLGKFPFWWAPHSGFFPKRSFLAFPLQPPPPHPVIPAVKRLEDTLLLFLQTASPKRTWVELPSLQEASTMSPNSDSPKALPLKATTITHSGEGHLEPLQECLVCIGGQVSCC